MDKKIKAVKKDLDKKMDRLVALDKPRDKKLKKCDQTMMKGKKHEYPKGESTKRKSTKRA